MLFAARGGIIFAKRCASEAAQRASLISRGHCRRRSIILLHGVTSKCEADFFLPCLQACQGINDLLYCTNTVGTRLPDHVSFDSAALLEPLSVAIHAVNRAKPEPGATALVMGAGTVGLLTAAMARQSGCTTVSICDVDQGRVDYALEHGFATHGYVVPRPFHTSSSSSSVVSSGTSTPPGGDGGDGTMTPASSLYSTLDSRLEGAKHLAQDILAVSKKKNDNSPSTFILNAADDDDDDDEGVDIAFECTGKEVCMHTSLYATKPGGKVIMVGMGTPIQTLPMSVAHLREVDILGIFRYANTYATGVRLLCASTKQGGARLPNLDHMVTHRIKGLHNAREAFELASRTVDDEGRLILKVVIEA